MMSQRSWLPKFASVWFCCYKTQKQEKYWDEWITGWCRVFRKTRTWDSPKPGLSWRGEGCDKEGPWVLDTAPWRLHWCPLQFATLAFIVYLHFCVFYATRNEEGRSCLSSGELRAAQGMWEAELSGSAGAAVRKQNACEGSFGTHKGCVEQMSQSLLVSPASLQEETGKYLRGITTHTYFHSVVLWQSRGYGLFSKQRRFPQRLHSQVVSPRWKERKAQAEACKMCARGAVKDWICDVLLPHPQTPGFVLNLRSIL